MQSHSREVTIVVALLGGILVVASVISDICITKRIQCRYIQNVVLHRLKQIGQLYLVK